MKRVFPATITKLRIIGGGTIGKVTSGTQSPSLGKAIGMGYVDSTMGNIDQQIMIKVRDKLLQARIVKFPFT